MGCDCLGGRGGGGMAVNALKDSNAFMFRVQKKHEGTRMLTAQKLHM